HIQLEVLEQAADLDVVTDIPEHFLVEDLQAVNVLAPGDDLHAGFFAAVVLTDGGAGMIRLEGVLDAQLYADAAQGAGGARSEERRVGKECGSRGRRGH